MTRCFLLLLLLATTWAPFLGAATLAFSPALGGARFDKPVDLDFVTVTRAYVCEQKTARIHVVVEGTASVAVDLSPRVGGKGNEEGLLALALAPDFTTSRRAYCWYTRQRPRRQTVLARLEADPHGRFDAASLVVLLVVDQVAGNHNGGDLVFGPEGMLYVSIGDGGKQGDPKNHGQNPGTLLGSILRIDPSRAVDGRPYAIPADNPFVGRRDSRPETWAYGFRNPWRMAFAADGSLWTGDVGQNKWEEVTPVVRGGNHGWNRVEGTHQYKGPAPREAIVPVFEYPHDARRGGFSITGGVFLDPRVYGDRGGDYLCADYQTGRFWLLEPAGREPAAATIVHEGERYRPSAFAVDPAGRAHVVDHRGGGIHALALE